MIVGALKDNKIITGKSDVKVDVHIRRVLGRLINGQGYSQQETGTVIDLTRKMYPDDPWMLDGPLHSLGIKNCKSVNPECASYYLSEYCNYYWTKQKADLS
jgi:endonuclease III